MKTKEKTKAEDQKILDTCRLAKKELSKFLCCYGDTDPITKLDSAITILMGRI